MGTEADIINHQALDDGHASLEGCMIMVEEAVQGAGGIAGADILSTVVG